MKSPTLHTEISAFMTGSPLRVEETTSLETALEIMHKAEIRHLPVVKKGELVGIISNRDISAKLAKGTIDPRQVTVKGVMKEKPYTVTPHTTLYEVTGTMVAKKYGSVIVVEENNIVGIFTAIDAMRILREICFAGSKYTES